MPTAAWLWPQQSQQAVRMLQNTGAVVLQLSHTGSMTRDMQRESTRVALGNLLATGLHARSDDITLQTTPGHMPALWIGARRMHVSFSHESTLSLIALTTTQPIGVDVVAPIATPDWPQECLQVAHTFLGPTCQERLQGMTPGLRPAHFALAWARQEAGLKCRGLQLQEWTPSLAAQLSGLQFTDLSLGNSLSAAVAMPARPTPAGHF